jgi:hypothetical protein
VQAIAVDCWNGSVASVQGYIAVTGYTFPVLRLGQTIQSLYGISYDNYVVIDADGIIRYTSVNETFTSLGRFNDTNLRNALTGEVTAAGDPDLGPAIRITNPVRAGEAITLRSAVPAAAETRIELFDARGRRLRDLPVPATSGWRVASWRADDRDGRPLATGVYFVRVQTPAGVIATRKFAVVKR